MGIQCENPIFGQTDVKPMSPVNTEREICLNQMYCCIYIHKGHQFSLFHLQTLLQYSINTV